MTDDPKNWTRQELLKRHVQHKASFKGIEAKSAKLEQDVAAERERAETAERQVRDLTRDLERERKRADTAEARLRSLGVTA
jgi:hypothetical protein